MEEQVIYLTGSWRANVTVIEYKVLRETPQFLFIEYVQTITGTQPDMKLHKIHRDSKKIHTSLHDAMSYARAEIVSEWDRVKGIVAGLEVQFAQVDTYLKENN